jgi:hypothetical protein
VSARSSSRRAPGGMRIGTVHSNHQPDEVARGDILDLYEAIGRFIEQARGEPGYDEHLVARPPPLGYWAVPEQEMEPADNYGPDGHGGW